MYSPITLAGTNVTGYVIDLFAAGTIFGSPPHNKCGAVTIGVNGTSGDFWVCPLGYLDTDTLPNPITADPRPVANATTYLRQIKSGESFTFGTPNSKGYDPAVHGSLPARINSASGSQTGYFTHVIVWCQAAGSIATTQLQIEGDPGVKN